MNLRRGFNRLYFVLFCGWVFFCFAIYPIINRNENRFQVNRTFSACLDYAKTDEAKKQCEDRFTRDIADGSILGFYRSVFSEPWEYFLILDGKAYDSKAIVAAAHRFQFPSEGPLRASDFSGGEQTVAKKLGQLGFTVRRERIDQESPLVLVQNDVTIGGQYDNWEDVTGVLYHFPNKYVNKVIEGRPFIYYRGVRTIEGNRRTPEYFGVGRIGRVWRDDKISDDAPKSRWHYYAELLDYCPFVTPVVWRNPEGVHYEDIPQNSYRDGARDISPEIFRRILEAAGVSTAFDTATDDVGPPQMPPISAVRPIIDTSLLVIKKQSLTPHGSVGMGGTSRRSRYANAIGKRGEEVVFLHLQTTLSPLELPSLRWLSDEGETPGWDLQFTSASIGPVRVEVKSTTAERFVSLEITAQEWAAAAQHRGSYHLYLVARCTSQTPRIQIIRDPYALYERQKITAIPVVWRLEMLAEVAADKKVGHP